MKMSARFYDIEPSLENYWRGVILFGLNVASYKFALGRSLLELAERKSDFVGLEELAEPFSRHNVRHVSSGKRQATSKSSRFLDVCRDYGQGNLKQEELIEKTTQLGFQNVIDAFHVVNGKEIPNRFFEDERKGSRKRTRNGSGSERRFLGVTVTVAERIHPIGISLRCTTCTMSWGGCRGTTPIKIFSLCAVVATSDGTIWPIRKVRPRKFRAHSSRGLKSKIGSDQGSNHI